MIRRSILVFLTLWCIADLRSAEKGIRSRTALTALGSPVYTYMDINNLSTVFRNDGVADIDRNEINSGLVYPKGSLKTAMFQSGFLWGAKINGETRVGGSVYRTGLQPGKILFPGVSEDPSLPKNRIYRIRPDFATGDLSSEVADEGVSASEIRTQYQTDWTEWPASDGAPYQDVNHDGAYDPLIDIPGVAGAAQTIWFVCNDNSSLQTFDLYGSNPMGVELQVTIWAFASPSGMDNAMFKSYLLVNKSATTFDSMYVSQWADPDVGTSVDDFVGVDTTLDLGFAYNANLTDLGYAPLPPPAVGFALLQGPTVPSAGDTARSRGRLIYNEKNLPMTASYYFARGDASVSDPAQGTYIGTLQFYNFLQGRIGVTGAPYTDPNTSLPTRFALAGDPVTRVGWIDGQVIPPGDRRLGLSCGPFTMAPGDTQEVIVAEIAAGAVPGVDHLSAITLLKYYARNVQIAFSSAAPTFPPSHFSCEQLFVDSSLTELHIVSDGHTVEADSMTITLKDYANVTVTSGPLFDDGFHGDGAAGDRVFGATFPTVPRGDGLYLDLRMVYHTGAKTLWPRFAENISTAGPIVVSAFAVASDNLNGDLRINPGEDVRYTVSLTNASHFPLTGVEAAANPDPHNASLAIGDMPAMSTQGTTYNPNDPRSYLAIYVSPTFLDSAAMAVLTIRDQQHNLWIDTVTLPVYPLVDSIYSVQTNHLAGPSSGDFDIRIVDPSALRNHLYTIRGESPADSTGIPRFTLTDVTDGRILLERHALPDSLGHTIPVTDGFKLFRGTIETRFGWADWSVPSGKRDWTYSNADGLALEGFLGAMGMGYHGPLFNSSVTPDLLHDVLIRFAATDINGNLLDPNDTTASNGYRYVRGAANSPVKPEFAPWIINPGSGYAYQDYRTKNVPFAAYDLQSNTRLMVGFLENNALGGRVDGIYWPDTQSGSYSNTDPSGPREWFFVFNLPYGSTPDPLLTVDLLRDTIPLSWWGTPNRRGDIAFDAGDAFLISAKHPPSASDVWTFNPTLISGVATSQAPAGFAVEQNYPNPFNPTTTITYRVPGVSRVSLKIFSVIGQEIRTLVDEVQGVGVKSVLWNSTNDQGRSVGSGVYFYRIQLSPPGEGRPSFVEIRKMVVVK